VTVHLSHANVCPAEEDDEEEVTHEEVAPVNTRAVYEVQATSHTAASHP